MARLDTLQDALASGDTTSLDETAGAIEEGVARINAEVHSPLWSVVGVLPVVGEDVRSVQALGDVGESLASGALAPVARSISGKGLSDLFEGHTVNVELLRSVAAAVSEALPVVSKASETVSALPEPHLPQLAEVLGKVRDPLAKAASLADRLQSVFDLLPQMLGADGQARTYLVIAQNNSELRATGGLPGSWGTLSVSDGTISLGDFITILHGGGLKVDISGEERAAIATNMDTDPAQVNCTADFTRVGELARDYWAQEGLGDVDGVVAIDPVFLQRLLSLTGGLTAPDGTVVDGTNAAQVLLSETYWRFGNDGSAQDAYFSSVAALAFEQVMNNLGSASASGLADALGRSAQDGRLLVWMANADEQDLMASLGLAGELGADPAAPVLGVYLNDDTYSKISWYASVHTEVGEGVANADGTTTYDVVTTISNTISDEEAASAPTYVYGNNPDKRDRSDMLDYVFLYAPAGGTITGLEASDDALFEDYGVAESSLCGLQVLRMRTHLRAGETARLTYQVSVSAQATEPLQVRTTPLAQESLM